MKFLTKHIPPLLKRYRSMRANPVNSPSGVGAPRLPPAPLSGCQTACARPGSHRTIFSLGAFLVLIAPLGFGVSLPQPASTAQASAKAVIDARQIMVGDQARLFLEVQN